MIVFAQFLCIIIWQLYFDIILNKDFKNKKLSHNTYFAEIFVRFTPNRTKIFNFSNFNLNSEAKLKAKYGCSYDYDA